VAPFRLGGRGAEDRRLHPARPRRAGPLRRAAGDDRHGGNGAQAVTPDEVDACAGRPLDLRIGPRRLAFTPEAFILSFSLPNFHFHAVTAYNILRAHGVPLGKRDYEGRLRTRS
jgi:hypothetical protein